MDSDSLTSEAQFDWRRRQIGRPGKEDRAMGSPPLESKHTRILLFEISTHKNRRACGDSLWSERKTVKLAKEWRQLLRSRKLKS
jgi:hypothetical protein